MNAPVRQNAFLLQLRIVLEQIVDRRISVGDVIDADDPAPIDLRPIRLDRRHVGQRDPMVFVVIGEKGQHRILVSHLGVEHRLVPLDHLLEAPGAVNHMNKPSGADTRHDGLTPQRRHGSTGLPLRLKASLVTGLHASVRPG
jgi:hypothetical protein